MSRFAVKYSDQELVHIVIGIATTVRPESPLEITQKQFDEGRESAGFAEAPRAYRVAERLKRGWDEVLELAFTRDSAEISLSARETNQLREKLTRPEVQYYLQSAARNLGVTELSVADYDKSRQALIDKDNRRHRQNRQGASDVIPSSPTIIRVAGTWEKALSWAGLDYRKKRPPRSYPADRALDDFVADYGFAPNYLVLMDYQSRRGVKTEECRSGFKAWRQEQLTTGLASRHGEVPILFKHEMPEGWKDQPITPVPDGYEMIRTGEITLDECRSDLLKAIDLAGDKRLTQDLYQRLSATHGLVALASVQKFAKRDAGLTWGQLRDQVIQENAKRPRSQGRHLRINQDPN